MSDVAGLRLYVIVTAADGSREERHADRVYFTTADTHGDADRLATRAQYDAEDAQVLFINPANVVSVAIDGIEVDASADD